MIVVRVCFMVDTAGTVVEVTREIGATDRENRGDDGEFAPGECDGSGTCSAPVHVHGCYRPHRSDECDSPDEYGHTDREVGSPDA